MQHNICCPSCQGPFCSQPKNIFSSYYRFRLGSAVDNFEFLRKISELFNRKCVIWFFKIFFEGWSSTLIDAKNMREMLWWCNSSTYVFDKIFFLFFLEERIFLFLSGNITKMSSSNIFPTGGSISMGRINSHLSIKRLYFLERIKVNSSFFFNLLFLSNTIWTTNISYK